MIKLDFKAAKEGFFDRKVVVDAVDRASLKVLSKFGAYVRTRAKSSIRKRKKSSQAGQPPSSHVGTLKNLIFFSFDQRKKSVVIGPTLITRSTMAPETLEHGGETDLPGHEFKTVDGKKVYKRTSKRVKIAKRPYMEPAFEAEKPGLPAMWENSIR